MKKALLIDLETSGLSFASGDFAIEVGCILYDLVVGAPVLSYASLIRASSNAAQAINRIDPRLLADAPEPAQVWPFVMRLASKADIILAHRAEFDRSFCPPELQALKWGCTKYDFPWPDQGDRVGPHLVHLALDLGLGVAHAHRAMSDVDTMARILTRVHEMGHSLPLLCERTQRPKGLFIANVTFEEKDRAKSAGFVWNDLVPKQWARRMFRDDVAQLPFVVREHVVQEGP